MEEKRTKRPSRRTLARRGRAARRATQAGQQRRRTSIRMGGAVVLMVAAAASVSGEGEVFDLSPAPQPIAESLGFDEPEPGEERSIADIAVVLGCAAAGGVAAFLLTRRG